MWLQANLVLERSTQKGAARSVLWYIGHIADRESHTAHPGVPKIAEAIKVAPRTVERCLAQLVEDGELELVFQGGGRKLANVYRLATIYWPKTPTTDRDIGEENPDPVSGYPDENPDNRPGYRARNPDTGSGRIYNKIRLEEVMDLFCPENDMSKLPTFESLEPEKQEQLLSVQDLIGFWQGLSKCYYPAGVEERKVDYINPAYDILERCGWNQDLARSLLVQERMRMVANGYAPAKLLAMLPKVVAAMDKWEMETGQETVAADADSAMAGFADLLGGS